MESETGRFVEREREKEGTVGGKVFTPNGK